jgi:hypothetical protein
MKITRAEALAGLFATLTTAVAGPALAQTVTGRDVTSVTCRLTRFVQRPYGRWQELGNDGARFDFQERQRDEWSVYLADAGRGVRLQLDLYTGKVMYADDGAPQMRVLYDITGSSAQVNGENVMTVRFAGGAYRMSGPGRWSEYGAGGAGARFTFEERQRDEWSVYLIDRSRNVEIQLDLYQHKIMYNAVGEARRPLYDITGSAAR